MSSTFDVCHVGVVLRAVLGVEGALALGLMLAFNEPQQWMMALASATMASLPAVLAWLLIVCGLSRALARSGRSVQAVALVVLGAACAVAGRELLAMASAESPPMWHVFGVAIVGACMAGVMLAWLRQRAREQLPADTQAQLAELQSRIRPHFLFNTLNSAMALVRVDPQKAEGLLEDLSELFRVALEDQGAAVSLAQEIDLARRYLEIEQVRFGERLRLDWQLDEEAGAARVPPLLLQPLVENAVRHGVEPNDEGGEVQVRTTRRGSEVEILVANSVGAPSRIPGHGLALDNLRRRLLLMHDVAARFELQQEPGRFTVRIMVPL
ncbi:sensor histidine kinase [Burkholderiaceae bacterium UC74_6]